jgi:hypothetical protein
VEEYLRLKLRVDVLILPMPASESSHV